MIPGGVEDPAFGASGGETFFGHYVDDTYPVRVKFIKEGDEFVHKFKFPGEVTFTYMPEGSTPDEWREIILENNGKVNDPLMLEQAVRSMERDDMAKWIKINTGVRVVSTGAELNVVDRYENNYGQNTVYKSCVKGTWWKPGEPNNIDVECIKVKAEGYSDYKPNFCYERKWDGASIAEIGLIAGEVTLGVAIGILVLPSGPGAIAAYCGTTTAVSAAGAWLLVGTIAADKWPHGIDQ